MKTVYFRADGNSTIGLGHVTRCLALADMLAEYFQCVFLAQSPSSALATQIRQNHGLIALPETTEYLAEADKLSKRYFSNAVIVVLDGYEFRTEYQRVVKESGGKLVCIDDLHAWHFVADVVINHAGGIKPQAYSCEKYTQLCLGAEYALLRKPFLEASGKPMVLRQNKNVFICFGGADPGGLTEKFVGFVGNMNWATAIIAVVGGAYAGLEQLLSLKTEFPNLEVNQDVSAEEMAALMGRCCFAIAPASSIGYELSAIGVIWLGGWYVENQKKIYEYFKNQGCLIPLGNFTATNESELRTFAAIIDSSQDRCQSLIEAQKRVIDGESGHRILEIFERYAGTDSHR